QFTGNGAAGTGLGAADFLLGLPTNVGVGANAGNRYLNNNLFAAFVQDNWRLNDQLTFNLGLRWEVNTPRNEVNNQVTNYDIHTGLNKPGSTFDQGFSGFPASGCTPAAALASSPACFSGAGIHAFSPNFRPAVSQQWNLSIQRQFGKATTIQLGYVGQKVDHLVDIFLLNQNVLNANGTVTPSPFLAGNPALKSAVGQIRLTDSSAIQRYHAFQAVLEQSLN